jgi:hypothetical protein
MVAHLTADLAEVEHELMRLNNSTARLVEHATSDRRNSDGLEA